MGRGMVVSYSFQLYIVTRKTLCRKKMCSVVALEDIGHQRIVLVHTNLAGLYCECGFETVEQSLDRAVESWALAVPVLSYAPQPIDGLVWL